jgi:hypothetical protein
MSYYGSIFLNLVTVPFHHIDMVWGIVPLYVGWFLNELTSPKPSFHTAMQTGFSFVWASAHWLWQYTHSAQHPGHITLSALFAVNMAVTLLVMGVGLVALWSGIRRKYPPGCAFLGHSRFSNYFMILIFPIQSNYIEWSWARLAAIFIFALPVWVLVNLGMFFLRRPKPGRRR